MSEKQLTGRELAAMEKDAAKTLELGGKKWYLIAGVVLFLIALPLPHIRGVMGWQVLFLTDTASDAHVRFAEYTFYWLGMIGVFFFPLVTLAFKRTWTAWVAWIFACVTVVYAVFAIWMRQTSTSTDTTVINVGMMAAIVGAICTVWGLSNIILARSDRQEEIAQMRAANPDMDGVASAQRDLLNKQQHSPESNPLLIDDRRARVARRRNRDAETEG